MRSSGESTSEHKGLCSAPSLWVQAEQYHYTGLCSNHDNKRPQNKREALACCQGLGEPYSRPGCKNPVCQNDILHWVNTPTSLLKHLVDQQLISPHQFGFIPGKSTSMQLLYLTEKWYRALERGKNVTAVFLDFQKAFDRVWHHGLLHQLTALGISPRSLTWLTSYLSDRSISVRVGSTCSEHKAISCGVPQGSHLGPVLFIIFINSLTHTVCIPTDIYADDTTLHHEHSPRAPACPSYQELQEAINCTEDWAKSWHGKFGHAKTRSMATSQDQLLQALTPTIDGQPIRIADNHRHLGVILSSNLNWSSHACNMLQTAAKRAGLLRVMSNDLPLPVATRLYIYYVRPTMEYACAVWHGSLREDIALSLERIQASVARLLRADWFTP